MKPAFLLALCFSLAAGAGIQAQTDTVLTILNRLRAPGGACAASASPLRLRAALDDAASAAARGAQLEAALKSSGYRATEAQVISVSGAGARAKLQTILAGRFCAQVGAAKLSEAGVYETRSQLWIILAAPFGPGLDLTRQQVAERMLALVNTARAEPRRCGGKAFGAAPPLAWNQVLERAAAQHARDMATHDYFNHEGRDGTSPAQRLERAGYRYRISGENIAAGQLSVEAAVAGWIKSPGHCANLMDVGFQEMGAAFAVNAQSAMGIYWAQVFGAPR